jgi:hypothetical protein
MNKKEVIIQREVVRIALGTVADRLPDNAMKRVVGGRSGDGKCVPCYCDWGFWGMVCGYTTEEIAFDCFSLC